MARPRVKKIGEIDLTANRTVRKPADESLLCDLNPAAFTDLIDVVAEFREASSDIPCHK